MSVILDVLNKLDARGVQRPGIASSVPALGTHNDRSSKRLWIVIALGAIAIGFTAFADWPNWLRNAPPKAAAAPEPVPSVAQPPAVAITPAPPPSPQQVGPGAPQSNTISATEPLPAASAPVAPPAPRPAVLAAPKPAALPRAIAVAPMVRETTPDIAANQPTIDRRDVALTASQRAQALLRQATDSAQTGQPRAALERAREALALDPTLAGARLLVAVLEHETGASDRAVQVLRDGLARDGRDGAQALLLARILIAQGDAPSALAALEQHRVQGADADGLRGGILTQQGDSTRAVAAYESAVRQQPANPMWWLGLALALDAEHQAPRARQAYARALAIGLPRADLVQYADQRLRAVD